MRAIAVALLFWTAAAATGAAQPYPNRPVRIIVPFAPGGPPDLVGRLVAQQLNIQTGQPFVVENRPGADGVIGAQAVAEAPRDGYTLLLTSSSFVINPSFHKKMPFDVVRDFEPVTAMAVIGGYILGVNPAVPARNVAELTALARAPKNHISYGSPGIGNGLHLAGELFKMLTKTSMVHVPYKGVAPALTGLLAGEVQVMFVTPPPTLSYIELGKIRALGYTGATRFAALPDVPTLAEQGVPGMEVLASWSGLFAPAGTPADVVARLNAEISKALAVPHVRERIIQLGLQPLGNSSAEFKPFVADQARRIAEIVKAAGIEPQ
jgi:tripartite-type tricarboxylate transporter receptor subunit TctC